MTMRDCLTIKPRGNKTGNFEKQLRVRIKQLLKRRDGLLQRSHDAELIEDKKYFGGKAKIVKDIISMLCQDLGIYK